MKPHHAAREISYSVAAKSLGGRTVIRMVENSTGRLGLIRRASGYHDEVTEAPDFWEVMARRYGLALDVVAGDIGAIPATGPLVLVANHPYGILDGLMLGWLLSQVRGGDFRILAHSVFRKAGELEDVILPISFDGTREATVTNLETRRRALDYLGTGGAIGVFPGGTVSTSARPFSQPLDPAWRTFTAKLIARSGATVVPVFFEGANSRLFQVASHLHSTLRVALLVREFRRRTDTPVRVAIGAPILPDDLAPYHRDPRAMMTHLRERTYALSGQTVPNELGFEFEDFYRSDALAL